MKVGILGHFGVGENLLNGQTVKTKMLADGIQKYSDIEVVKIDSHNWRKRPLNLHRNIKKAFQECDAVVMLPAQNGVRVFAPLLIYFKKKYRKKVFYDVIGGWLPEFLEDRKILVKTLKSFNGIWVETNTMRNKLLDQGLDNVVVIPNFKELRPLSNNELVYPVGIPYRLCTFSRVMKEKGIGVAVDAVCKVNEQLGYTAYTLDIYGQIETGQEDWFNNLKTKFSSHIQYRGCADSSKSIDILKDYFALLFPTYYAGEGFAGTLIDACSAGVPVIASDWRYNSEIINERTGYVYPVQDNDALVDILLNVVVNPNLLLSKKEGCLEESKKYKAETVINYLITML